MKSKKIIGIVTFILIYTCFGCNIGKHFCGEPSPQTRATLDSLEKMYNVRIDPIPCEYVYLNVQINSDYNDSTLYSLHKAILAHTSWLHLHFINSENKLLFEQDYNLYDSSFVRSPK